MSTDPTLVVLGASGDLAARLLFPSLLSLEHRERLEGLKIIGYARQDWTNDQFHDNLRAAIEERHAEITHDPLPVVSAVGHEIDFTLAPHQSAAIHPQPDAAVLALKLLKAYFTEDFEIPIFFWLSRCCESLSFSWQMYSMMSPLSIGVITVTFTGLV